MDTGVGVGYRSRGWILEKDLDSTVGVGYWSRVGYRSRGWILEYGLDTGVGVGYWSTGWILE